MHDESYPDGVRQGERDGQRQSLWNSDDEDRDADDEELDELLDVLHLPGSLTYDERFHAEPQHEDYHRQHSSHRTCIAQRSDSKMTPALTGSDQITVDGDLHAFFLFSSDSFTLTYLGHL